MQIAITRAVSRDIARMCSSPNGHQIDYKKACRQHGDYIERLVRAKMLVVSILTGPLLPLAVFVEDSAVVVDEVAVMTRQGASDRRAEGDTISPTLACYRPLKFMTPPATLDGGDIIRVDRTLFVGLSERTNLAGITQLREILGPYGYEIKAVEVRNGSHLKSACTYIGRKTMLMNPKKVDADAFEGFEMVEVPKSEQDAGNTMLVGDKLLLSSTFTETEDLLTRRGFDVQAIDISEFQKAGGALSCMSLIFQCH